MTMNCEAGNGRASASDVDYARSLSNWLALGAIFVVAILMRQVVAANSDVSWLLIAGERWLDGQRLYSEILEINPPMAVLVYVPGILIARAIGLSAEVVVDALLFLAIALSIAVTALILRRSRAVVPHQRWPLAMMAVVVLAALPVQAFGQREHIAMLEFMPAIAVVARRLNREAPSVWAIGIAGAGLGLALCFKPHFAFPVFCWYGVAAASLRSPRILVAPENLIAAGVVGAYGAVTILFFPEYFSVAVPFLRDVYSVGQPLGVMLMKPAVPLWATMMLAVLLLKRTWRFEPTLLLLMTASASFAVVYLVQRKGWPYHSYPMMAFAWLAFGYVLSSRTGAWLRRWSAGEAAAAAALFMASVIWFNCSVDTRALQPAIARLGLQHPTILAISGNPGVAHPLTRAVGGIWAARQPAQLAWGYEDEARDSGTADPQTLAVLERYAQRERGWLIDDFRRYRPSIVLVENARASWLHESPELEGLMKGYRLSETVEYVDIYVRRPE